MQPNMPEKSLMCTNQKSEKLCHFSLSLTLFLLLLSMHIIKHWEIFRKEREGEMKCIPQGQEADSSPTGKELHVAAECRGELAPQGVDIGRGEAGDERQRDGERLLSLHPGDCTEKQ